MEAYRRYKVELVILHLLTHEIPILLVGVTSLIFGKRAVLKYVRKHDPAVQELRSAAFDAAENLAHTPYWETNVRLNAAIDAIECKKECGH